MSELHEELRRAVRKAFANAGVANTCEIVNADGDVCVECVDRARDLAARGHYERERQAAPWIDLGGEAGGA